MPILTRCRSVGLVVLTLATATVGFACKPRTEPSTEPAPEGTQKAPVEPKEEKPEWTPKPIEPIGGGPSEEVTPPPLPKPAAAPKPKPSASAPSPSAMPSGWKPWVPPSAIPWPMPSTLPSAWPFPAPSGSTMQPTE